MASCTNLHLDCRNFVYDQSSHINPRLVNFYFKILIILNLISFYVKSFFLEIGRWIRETSTDFRVEICRIRLFQILRIIIIFSLKYFILFIFLDFTKWILGTYTKITKLQLLPDFEFCDIRPEICNLKDLYSLAITTDNINELSRVLRLFI